MLPIILDFWHNNIDTYQCCAGYMEDLVNGECDPDDYPEIYPWIMCDASNKKYIEENYNVNIHKNNHFGYYVYEYVEEFLNIDKMQDFLFVVFKDLKKKIKRPKFTDIVIPEWRKYDRGYDDIPLKEYILELEKYIDYLEEKLSNKEKYNETTL
jgi:hypothetical protein